MHLQLHGSAGAQPQLASYERAVFFHDAPLRH
jgi:hypothetical protein